MSDSNNNNERDTKVIQSLKSDVPKRKKIILLILISALLVSVLGYLFYVYLESIEKQDITEDATEVSSYVIPGVPAFVRHEEVALNSGITSHGAATIYTLLSYWGEGLDAQDATTAYELENLFIDDNTGTYGGPQWGKMQKYFSDRGYSARIEHLRSPEELLRRYLNADTRVPLFFNHVFDSQYPRAFTYSLLLGIDLEEEQYITYNFHLGNYNKISFTEMKELWAATPKDIEDKYSLKNKYWVFIPEDSKKLSTVKQNKTYPDTDFAFYEELQPVTALHLAAHQAHDSMEKRSGFFEEEFAHDNSSLLHPLYQMNDYAIMAATQYWLNDSGKVETYSQMTLNLADEIEAEYSERLIYGHYLWHIYGVLNRYYTDVGDVESLRETQEEYEKVIEKYPPIHP